jgi:hypothetical protein
MVTSDDADPIPETKLQAVFDLIRSKEDPMPVFLALWKRVMDLVSRCTLLLSRSSWNLAETPAKHRQGALRP